eukprot:s307_g7.t1
MSHTLAMEKHPGSSLGLYRRETSGTQLSTPMDEELLRGVPLDVLLGGFGRHFVPPEKGMFNLDSKKYSFRLDHFLSHDWGTSRFLKVVALLVTFNTTAASIATIVVSILMGAIYAMWGESLFPDGFGNVVGMARLGRASTGLGTFWIFLCFWQRMRRIFAGPKMTFLDTLCIAQHDEAKKKQGIFGLSTFLDHSEHLTILWSRNFFSRLWCTYEVSTFLRHKHEKQVQVMPVTLAWLFLVMIILIQVTSMINLVKDECDCMALLIVVRSCLAIPGYTFLIYTGIGLIQDLRLNASDSATKPQGVYYIEATRNNPFFCGKSICVLTLFAEPPLPSSDIVGCSNPGYGLKYGDIQKPDDSREPCQDLNDLARQLQVFSAEEAECFCCSCNHVHPETGRPLPCDRDLVLRTMTHWFASCEEFDRLVRDRLIKKVFSSIQALLTAQYPIHVAIAGTVPLLILQIPLFFQEEHQDVDAALKHFATWARLPLTTLASTFILMVACRLGAAIVQHRGNCCRGFVSLLLACLCPVLVSLVWIPIDILDNNTGDKGGLLIVPVTALFWLHTYCCMHLNRNEVAASDLPSTVAGSNFEESDADQINVQHVGESEKMRLDLMNIEVLKGDFKATAAAYSEHNQVEMRRLMVSPWTEELSSEASSVQNDSVATLQSLGRYPPFMQTITFGKPSEKQSVLQWAPPCAQSEPCYSRMESPPSAPLTLVPAASASRRRRHEDGESRSRRRRGSRSRDRRRQSPPPADWRGPAEGWRPPQEWAGYAPPNHGGHMGWPPPQRPMYRPPGYGPWGVPPPREPMDWRPGAPSGTPALPAGAPGTWTPPGAAPPNHWGGGPPSHWGGPSTPAAPFAKGPFEQSPAPAVVENGHSAGAVPAAAVEPTLVEEPLPPAPTASERLRSVRLVSSALSEQMLEKLHSLGVMPKKGKEPVEKVPEAGFRSDLTSGAQCDLLGLGFGNGTALGSAQKLPAPVGKRRVPATPVCTLGLAPGGLWERFRQRCGTPWPPEPPVFIPQLRSSKAGGHVVVLAVRGEAR